MEAGKCEDEKIAKRCMKTCDMCEEEPKKSNYFRFTLKCNISSFLKEVINTLSNQKSSLDMATNQVVQISTPFLRLSLIMRNYEQYDYYKSLYFLLAHKNLMIIIIVFNFVIIDHQK